MFFYLLIDLCTNMHFISSTCLPIVCGTKDRTEEQCRELLRKFWSLSYYLEYDEAIYFLIKSHMEKKTYLLSNLKKQVIALKTQLEKL